MSLNIKIIEFPDDILNNILSRYYKKGSYYHYALNFFYHIQYYSYYKKFKHILRIYKNQDSDTYISWFSLLKNNFTTQQSNNFIKQLYDCKCCKRHQSKKPTNVNDNFCFPINEQDKNYSCKCNCRHLSRFLCRINAE
jgi:hypothetical protein